MKFKVAVKFAKAAGVLIEIRLRPNMHFKYHIVLVLNYRWSQATASVLSFTKLTPVQPV